MTVSADAAGGQHGERTGDARRRPRARSAPVAAPPLRQKLNRSLPSLPDDDTRSGIFMRPDMVERSVTAIY